MTDNEKRAHDFAVALVPLMTDFRVRGSAQKGESDVYLDPYHEYRNVYDYCSITGSTPLFFRRS